MPFVYPKSRMEFRRKLDEMRERAVREKLERDRVGQDVLVNNLINVRLQSRRRKVLEEPDDQTNRKVKAHSRLLQKLINRKVAAAKEKLAKFKNERKATQENAKDSGSRPGKAKKKPRKKASSSQKEVLGKDKNAACQKESYPQERKALLPSREIRPGPPQVRGEAAQEKAVV